MFTCIHIYTHVYTYIHSIRLPIYTSSRQLPLLKQPYICITHTFLYVYAFYTHMYVCAIYIHMYTPVLTHTYMQSIYTYTCNLYVQSICAIYIHLLIERTPPPRVGFPMYYVCYVLCSLSKNPEEEDPPRSTWYKFFEGVPLPSVS